MAVFHIFPTYPPTVTTFDPYNGSSGQVDGLIAVGGHGLIEYDFSESVMYLDGNPTPLLLADLPTGFTITSAQFKVATQAGGGSGEVGDGSVSFDAFSFGTTPSAQGVGDRTLLSFDIPGPYSEISYIGLNNVITRFTAVVESPGSPGFTEWDTWAGTAGLIPFILSGAQPTNGIFVTGTYTTVAFQWALFFEDEEIAGVPFRRVTFEEFSPGAGPPDGYDLVTDTLPVEVWWEFELPYGGFIYVYQALTPGTGWTQVAAPENYGWWDSMQEAFLGNAAIVVDATPKRPRGFEQIVSFATGTASPYGGHPGPGVMLRQKLVYAGGSYVVGTDYPVVRVFDGLSDRELVRIPPTGSGGIPKAVMSMMTINGVIYLTTLDSGTTHADFAGRVFSLDLSAAKLELIGAAFSGGEVPYCLAWHNGRLWCGTNQQDPAQSGAVYWFRPGIDSVWTQDKVLSTEGQGGATSMISFGGKLFVGCSAAAGTAAEILARSPDGTWAVSFTGPETDSNNGYPAMTVWPIVQPSLYGEPHLFASYWSQDTGSGPDTSLIKKFDGTTWTTSYTGTGDTLLPFIALANINTVLYAVGGGYDLPVQLLVSFDGSNWTTVTEFLPDNADETATNILVDMRQ